MDKKECIVTEFTTGIVEEENKSNDNIQSISHGSGKFIQMDDALNGLKLDISVVKYDDTIDEQPLFFNAILYYDNADFEKRREEFDFSKEYLLRIEFPDLFKYTFKRVVFVVFDDEEENVHSFGRYFKDATYDENDRFFVTDLFNRMGSNNEMKVILYYEDELQ